MTDKGTYHPNPGQQAQQHASVNAYTQRMFWLKIVLPLGAVALIGLLVLWPYLRPEEILPQDLEAQKVELTQNGLSMSEPRFSGTTEKNEPFMITAKTAQQSDNDPALVELIAIQANLDLVNLGDLKMDASGGKYHTINRRLQLIGPIELRAPNGVMLTLGDVHADMKNSTGHSDQPLTLDAGAAIMKAGGLKVMDGGNRLRFDRGVHITYYPDRPLPVFAPASDGADTKLETTPQSNGTTTSKTEINQGD